MLFYFRFPAPFYAISRFTFVALDTASLLRAALPAEYDWLKASGAVQGLARSAQLLLRTLTANFVPGHLNPEQPDAEQREAWRNRLMAAVAKFRDAGIHVRTDLAAAAEEYIGERKQWDCYIRRLAPYMAYPLAEIDTVTPAPRRS